MHERRALRHATKHRGAKRPFGLWAANDVVESTVVAIAKTTSRVEFIVGRFRETDRRPAIADVAKHNRDDARHQRPRRPVRAGGEEQGVGEGLRLPKRSPEHFAHHRLRQLRSELERRWDLVWRQAFLTEIAELGLRGRMS